MDSLKSAWRRVTGEVKSEQEYERVADVDTVSETEPLRLSFENGNTMEDGPSLQDGADEEEPFSWITYCVFLLLGIAMLWAWNMFLAASPYFQKRFASSPWILKNFQSTELSASTVLNLASVLLLAQLQQRASYPKRIVTALAMNILAFTLLAISTKSFTDVSAATYFGFLIAIVLFAALSTGILQNGIFAYVAGFRREDYMQGIMMGQAIAGVAPCVVQIVTVLSAPASDVSVVPVPTPDGSSPPATSSNSAFAYFMTATGISTLTLAAFLAMAAYRRSEAYLTLERNRRRSTIVGDQPKRESVPLSVLAYKLRWLGGAVALSFAITMFFPVFTQRIPSIRSSDTGTSPSGTSLTSRLFDSETFIPLAQLFWNSGDLLGRMLVAFPALRISHRPYLVFTLAALRIAFVPLYYLCNLDGKGAAVNSDFFYLIVVQLLFGISNGYIGSSAMMGAPDYVDPEEREAAGGFMGLALVAGLTAGSLMSFVFA